MINKYIKKFNIIINFLLFISITNAAQKIDVSDVRITMSIVNDNGEIFKEFREEFINKTGVSRDIKNIQKWKTFKSNLDSREKKSLAGEVSARFLFENLGYKILEEHYAERITQLNSPIQAGNGIFKEEACTTKKGPDNGIDGLFIHQSETINSHDHIIINEAKFRNKLELSEYDFGFVEVPNHIQQSHSDWNRPRFTWPTCLHGLDYDKETVLRTATLLDKNGVVKLYEVRDKGDPEKIKGTYASEAPKNWKIKKAYDKLTEHLNN